MTIARSTQQVTRVVSDGTPKARVTQTVTRVVSDGTPKARATQMVIRVVSSTDEVAAPVTPQPIINVCM